MKNGRSGCTNITPHEHIVLYPTFGHLVDDGSTWRIPVYGSIYEPGVVTLRRKLLLRVLRRVMDVAPEALDTEIFRQRIAAFIAATERGKRVALSAGSRIYRLQKKTKRNGQFSGTVRLPAQNIAELCNRSDHGWLEFGVVTPDGDSRVFAGRAQLLGDEGVSVISDIDDTIKHSDVGSRRALLANTFLREFQSISGMAERYQNWADDGAAFHYVSSSPWQLYEPLAELRECAGFPQGSFHLRAFRLRDHMLRRVLLLRRHGKSTVMRQLLRTFPRRRFVLVGDAGERDPELYGSVARRFRDRVAAIYIRRMASHDWTRSRAEKAFRGLHPDMWHIFEQADELPKRLTMMATC